MTNTIDIVYIGDKPVKRDTVTNSRLLFPQHEAVPVEKAIALQLLEYSTVWRRAEDLPAILQAHKDAEDAARRAAEQQAAEEAARRAEADMRAGDIDLGKMTSVQLRTLVESEDLGITQAPQEKVDEFRRRVRDALRAKLGNA